MQIQINDAKHSQEITPHLHQELEHLSDTHKYIKKNKSTHLSLPGYKLTDEQKETPGRYIRHVAC